MNIVHKKEQFELKPMPQAQAQGPNRIMSIINLLGGPNNIEDVAACATRLRVTVKSHQGINGDDFIPLGAKGSIIKDGGVQVIFGGEAAIIADEINDILESGVDITPTTPPQPIPIVTPTPLSKSPESKSKKSRY